MKITYILLSGALLAFLGVSYAPRMYVYESLTVTTKYIPTPTPTPTDKEIIDEIVRVFSPEGKRVVLQALNCFYSESGLRWDALHLNTNGTHDGGVAQINDVHKLTLQERLDYKRNIQKAYEIYKRSGWNPWMASGCRY